jgi:uncharacterized protein YkwD
VEQTGARVSTTEPIVTLALQFESELDLACAAAELDCKPQELLRHLDDSAVLARALGVLKIEGGTVQRQAFTAAFADIVQELQGKEDSSTEKDKAGEKEKPAEKDRPIERPDSAAIEKALVELLNKERAREKLPALKVNPLMGEAARLHSENMAKQEKQTHVLDGKNPGDRLRAVGYAYDYMAENVAQGSWTDTAAAIHAMWMNNEGTRANLLNARVKEVGIAAVKNGTGNAYYTLVLATPRK